MARPSKYDWDSIKQAFEDGIERDVISRKYKVSRKTLDNKIALEKWEVSGELNSHVEAFRDSLGEISRNIENDPIKAEIVHEKITTILEDNAIIANNRKLATAFQRLIGQGIKAGQYKTPQDIKAGVGAVRDIEAIANPQASKIEVNNQNNVAVVPQLNIKMND